MSKKVLPILQKMIIKTVKLLSLMPRENILSCQPGGGGGGTAIYGLYRYVPL